MLGARTFFISSILEEAEDTDMSHHRNVAVPVTSLEIRFEIVSISQRQEHQRTNVRPGSGMGNPMAITIL